MRRGRSGVIIGLVALAACTPAPVAGVVVTQVTTSGADNGWAVNYPKQRKVFEMAGRLWLFYSDGADAVVRTSLDGTSWSEPTVVRAKSTFGHRIGFAFDGQFLHYAHCNAELGEPITYRRGLPHEDGSIEWSTTEQIAFDVPSGQNAMYPKVVVDSGGRPWVAFMLYDGGFGAPPYDAIVSRSSTADGTWNASPGFPFTLVSQNTTAYSDPAGVALTGDMTYWVYNRNSLDDVYYGRRWNGAGWDDEEHATRSHEGYSLYNLVADGDDVHLAFAGGTLRYRKRDHLKGWLDEQTIAESASGHASIALAGPDHVTVTWLDERANLVLTRERSQGGTWGAAGLLADESAQTLANPKLGINLNGLATATGKFHLAATWTTGTAAPWPLKIAIVR